MTTMKRFARVGRAALLSSVLVAGAAALAADATLNQVYEALHGGRLAQAQAMMTEVLRDHPDSAKARYVEAEILAKQGRAREAQGELDRAERPPPIARLI
jgi:Tfp pilus assembly protein PilF